MFGYAGLGPGQELIPYFLAMLAFIGAAVGAVLQWPIAMALRCFSRLRGKKPPEQPATQDVAESAGDVCEAGKDGFDDQDKVTQDVAESAGDVSRD